MDKVKEDQRQREQEKRDIQRKQAQVVLKLFHLDGQSASQSVSLFFLSSISWCGSGKP